MKFLKRLKQVIIGLIASSLIFQSANALEYFPSRLISPEGLNIKVTKCVEYDPLMQVKGIKVKDPAENLVMDYSYTRDKEGNILTKNTQAGNYAYTYDPTYQLLKTVYPDGKSEEFNYDKAGNRLSQTVGAGLVPAQTTAYSHNANNEMLTAGSTSFEFDNNGNMTKKTEGANVFEYLYNVENRLSAVKLNGHTLATYGYDPFGRRLWKQVEGVKTYFFYTDEGLSAEINNAGEVVKTYGYTPNSIWTTDPLWTRESGQYYFYQNDHLATPQMITSSNGQTVWSAEYESFGKATVKDGSSVTNNLRFPGQYFDSETGEHYNYKRIFYPGLGRYNQEDPLKFSHGERNLYRYVFNNVTNLKDPRGEFAWVIVGGIIGAGANLGITALLNGGFGNLTGPQIAASLASGFISGSLGAMAGPLGGSIAQAFGLTSNGVASALAAGGLSAGAGGIGQLVANYIDPCNAVSVMKAALWGGLGGGIAKKLFPTKNLNSWAQALTFAPKTFGGTVGSMNAWTNVSSFATSSAVGGAANF